MDGQIEVMELILRWVWAPMGLLLVWTIRRLLGVESGLTKRRAIVDRNIAEMNTTLAVMKATQESFGVKLDSVESRNDVAHEKIEKKLDDGLGRVMNRLDSLLTIARNGSK